MGRADFLEMNANDLLVPHWGIGLRGVRGRCLVGGCRSVVLVRSLDREVAGNG